MRRPGWASNGFPALAEARVLAAETQVGIHPVPCASRSTSAGCRSLRSLCALNHGSAAPGRLSKQRHRGKAIPRAFRGVMGSASTLGALGCGVSLLLRTHWPKAGAQKLRGKSQAAALGSWSPAESCARAGMVPFRPTKPKLIYSCSAVHSPKLLTHLRGKISQ